MKPSSDFCFQVAPCTLGYVLIACTPTGIAAILPGDSPEAVMQDFTVIFPKANIRQPDRADQAMIRHALAVVDRKAAPDDLALTLGGTLFTQKVWRALRDIPLGETRSYAEIAQVIGLASATRAVARACAANVLAVAIPCHRVVRTDGTLSGYRWGQARKEMLLAREASAKQTVSPA